MGERFGKDQGGEEITASGLGAEPEGAGMNTEI
jgi:hypothetical protein